MVKSLFLALFVVAYGSDVTLQFIETLPKSNEKDYYIWRFLGQNITPEEANRAYKQASRSNGKLDSIYVKKGDDQAVIRRYGCQNMGVKDLIALEDLECLDMGMTTFKATALDKPTLKQLSLKLETKNPKKSAIYEVLSSPIPYSRMMMVGEKEFLDVFNLVGETYRRENFNYFIPPKYLNRLIKEPAFNAFVKKVVLDPKMDKVQKSLLGINSSSFTFDTNFYLGINAITHDSIGTAKFYFELARSKAKSSLQVDNTTFWLYKLTQKRPYLEALNNSKSVNIYTIFAKEELGTEFTNIISDVPNTNTVSSFNTSNPFDWLKVREDMKSLDTDKVLYYKELFNTDETKAHQALILEKQSGFKDAYFVLPWEPYLQDIPTDRKALIYALGKQESQFIPAVISTSFALGPMQFMPFLIDATAKVLKDDITDYDQMFEPARAIRYANNHLNYLTSTFDNYLFVAYAYNGGGGYTSRLLKGGLFGESNPYEPFLSMEYVTFDETKHYGKIVLANYIIYKKLLGEPVSLSTLLQRIKSPHRISNVSN